MSASSELWGFVKRYYACLEELGDRLEFLVVVGSEARYGTFCEQICHPDLQRVSKGRFEISVSLYQVKKGVPNLRSLIAPSGAIS